MMRRRRKVETRNKKQATKKKNSSKTISYRHASVPPAARLGYFLPAGRQVAQPFLGQFNDYTALDHAKGWVSSVSLWLSSFAELLVRHSEKGEAEQLILKACFN